MSSSSVLLEFPDQRERLLAPHAALEGSVKLFGLHSDPLCSLFGTKKTETSYQYFSCLGGKCRKEGEEWPQTHWASSHLDGIGWSPASCWEP